MLTISPLFCGKARFLFLMTLVLTCSLSAAANLFAQEKAEEEALIGPQSEIVAVVNDENLTRGQLADLLIESFGAQGLDVLVRRTIIYQQADNLGVSVTPEEVSKRLDRLLDREIQKLIKARGYEDEDQLNEEMKNMGLDLDDVKETMTERLRNGMEVEVLAEKIVATTVTVTDEDLERAYEEEYGEKIEAVQIVLNTRKEADEVLEKLQSGANFETLARNVSIDRLSAAAGGRMRPFSPKEGFFGPKVTYLEVGQVSDIIRSDDGYHILKIIDLRDQSSKDFEDVKPELEEVVKRQKVQKRLAPWLTSVMERAEVKKYLITY